jgi:hypothetical protein
MSKRVILFIINGVFFLTFASCQVNSTEHKLGEFSAFSGDEAPKTIQVAAAKMSYQQLFQQVYGAATGTSKTDITFKRYNWLISVAGAEIKANKRYIYYNQEKFDLISNQTVEQNPIKVILAHEISHLVNNHPLRKDQTSMYFELEADFFSGIVMRDLGVPLKDGLKTLEDFGNQYQTRTHPDINKRKKYLKKGWVVRSYSIYQSRNMVFDSLMWSSTNNRFGSSEDSLYFADNYTDFLRSRAKVDSMIKRAGMTIQQLLKSMNLDELNDVGTTDFYFPIEETILSSNKEKKDVEQRLSINLDKASLGRLYDLPIAVIEGKVYDQYVREFGSLISVESKRYLYEILLADNVLKVDRDGKIVKDFPNGETAIIGFLNVGR